MIQIQRKEQPSSQRAQAIVFEKICNLIESDKVYYNKQIKSTAPAKPQQLLSIENKYRKRCGRAELQPNEISKLRLKQVLVGDGSLVTSKRYECDSQQFAEVISLQLPEDIEVPPKSEFSFLDLMTQNIKLDSYNIGCICNNKAYSFEVRRFLSLYSILFQGKVHFEIGRNSQQEYDIKFLELARNNTEELRIEQFKNWLAWIINSELIEQLAKDQVFLHNSKLSNALARRKPQESMAFLYVNNRWEDAQFMINIEDAGFRSYYSTIKNYLLAPELQDILSERVDKLNKSIFNWFLLMAFSTWYLKKNSVIDNLLEVMELVPQENVNNFQMEFRLIQLFLCKSGKTFRKSSLFTPSSSSLTSQKLICLYLMSNHLELAQYQQSIISTTTEDKTEKNQIYSYYRYHILSKIIEIYPSSQYQSLIRFIKNDKIISKQERQAFKKRIEKRYTNEGLQLDYTKDSKLEIEADTLIAQGKLYQGLKKLFQIKKWSDFIFEKVCRVVTSPSILVSYKRQVSFAVQKLLSQRNQLFYDLLLILSIGRREKVTCKQSLRLIEILQGYSRFSSFINPLVRSFLLNFLEKLILQALVLRNEFLVTITINVDVKSAIRELFQEKFEVFYKMEETIAKL